MSLAEVAKRCKLRLEAVRAEASIHLSVAGPQGTRCIYALCGRYGNLRATNVTSLVTCAECNYYIQESEDADRAVPF